jgi:hypothetical protein
MDYINKLMGAFSHTGGKRRRSNRNRKTRGGGAASGCETGAACQAAFAANTSLSQGEDFAKMTRPFHGGKRRRNTRRMRGGFADIKTAFDVLPEDMTKAAGTAVLDANIAELPKFTQAGGARRRTRRSRMRGGAALVLSPAPIDAPTMLLDASEYQNAFINPQWETENLVNPNFQAPDAPIVAAGVQTGGRRRKGYKKSRKMKGGKRSRKGSRKSRKMKGGKRSRKGSRKSRKMKGGKRSRKGSKKSRRKSRKGRKGSRKH